MASMYNLATFFAVSKCRPTTVLPAAC